jgi:pimeloyl-ACP methyl ester carboxylesterase
MNEARYRDAERALFEHYGLRTSEQRVHLARVGLDVRVIEAGEGPTILFVHGASNGASSWTSLAAALEGYHCVLLDRPGCGLSDRVPHRFDSVDTFATYAETVLVDVLDALGLERVDLVTTSLGGYLGLRTTAAHPERVGRLVELGWSVGAPPAHVPMVMRAAMVGPVGKMMTSLPPPTSAVRAMLRRIGLKDALASGRVPDEAVQCFRSLMRDTDTMRNELDAGPPIVTLRGMNETILLPDEVLRSITRPTYFLWGENDPFGDADIARPFVARIPGAELELLPGAGHAVWMDDAPLVADRIRGFLSR